MAESKSDVSVLKLLALEFPNYGKNIVKIVSDIHSMSVKKDLAIAVSHVDSFEPFTVKTSDVVLALLEWQRFLVKYENGKIPGIIPTNRASTWICVPREQVKDEYLVLLEKEKG